MFDKIAPSALVLTIALLVTSAAAAESNDEATIRSIPERIAQNWNRGDGAALASVYAEDGVLVAGHGVVKHGRTEIAAYHEDLFATSAKGTRLTVRVTDVRFLNAGTAILQTEGGILWRDETSLAPGNRGIQSFVVVKGDAGWRVVLFQNTRILDP